VKQQAHIFVLRGGLVGPDGAIDSIGMDQLAERLKEFGHVTTLFWNDFGYAIQMIKHLLEDDKIIIIGYSGGGSRATWVAGAVYPSKIKLVVAYDPSPWWQMAPLKDNVEKAICYHNNAPLMFGLGGGHLTGHENYLENVEIAEQHLTVQFDRRLHERTIAAVRAVVET
jgi:pimeloyl-ACP methyl ester carboxylesterase